MGRPWGIAAGIAAVVALVAGLLSIDWSSSCQQLDCTDGVFYEIPVEAYEAWGASPDAPITVATCIDEECRTVEITGGVAGDPVAGEVRLDRGTLDLDGAYETSLRVTDSAGAEQFSRRDADVALTAFRPNGPDCPPRCATWKLALEPEEVGL